VRVRACDSALAPGACAEGAEPPPPPGAAAPPRPTALPRPIARPPLHTHTLPLPPLLLPPETRPQQNGDIATSKIKQVASGRFGVTPEFLVNADQLEIKIAQARDPGGVLIGGGASCFLSVGHNPICQASSPQSHNGGEGDGQRAHAY
jgi:hypothetical protein